MGEMSTTGSGCAWLEGELVRIAGAKPVLAPRRSIVWMDAGDRALAFDVGGSSALVVMHTLNGYELGHVGGRDDYRSTSRHEPALLLPPDTSLELALERATPHPVYFSARPVHELPAAPPETRWTKVKKKLFGGLFEVRVGSLRALVSHEHMIEPTRRELEELYGVPFTTGVEGFDSIVSAQSGAPDDTRRRLLECALLDDCRATIESNAPMSSAIHFGGGKLAWNTTLTDRTSAAHLVEVARFLSRLAHGLYDA